MRQSYVALAVLLPIVMFASLATISLAVMHTQPLGDPLPPTPHTHPAGGGDEGPPTPKINPLDDPLPPRPG